MGAAESAILPSLARQGGQPVRYGATHLERHAAPSLGDFAGSSPVPYRIRHDIRSSATPRCGLAMQAASDHRRGRGNMVDRASLFLPD